MQAVGRGRAAPSGGRITTVGEVMGMKNGAIPDSVIRRMGRYMRAVERLEDKGVTVIASRDLGKLLDYTPSQVRQDLNYFGKYGLQGFGYAVGLLHDDLIHILGADRGIPAAVVGTGNIGSYLLERGVLQKCGFHVGSAFDLSPQFTGREIGGVAVRDIALLPDFVRETPILYAALCVPPSAAQATADALICCGVRAIWNITGRDLVLPRTVLTESAHLEDSLLSIGYRLGQGKAETELASGE